MVPKYQEGEGSKLKFIWEMRETPSYLGKKYSCGLVYARDKLLMLRMESCSKWNNQKEFGQCSERIGTIKTTGLIVHMLANYLLLRQLSVARVSGCLDRLCLKFKRQS